MSTRSWTTQTRPYIAFAVALLSQVTEEHYHENSKKFKIDINKIIKSLHEVPYKPLKYFKFGNNIHKLQDYSGAPFSSNYDKSLQIG